jgi:hypothetical protein
MAHSSNIISQVKLPGSDTIYEIHDAHAIHSASELGVSGVFTFKGVLDNLDLLAAIAANANSQGYVYLVTSLTATTEAGKALIPDSHYTGNLEYACVNVDGSTYRWEPLGATH